MTYNVTWKTYADIGERKSVRLKFILVYSFSFSSSAEIIFARPIFS